MRSLLFVPGDDPRKIAKAFASGADAVILDLEDSVAPARREAARSATREALSAFQDGPARLVRVNGLATSDLAGDLAAVMEGAPDGIVLPKCCGGRDALQLAALLAVAEAEHGLADGATRLIAIATETAASLFALGSFAGATQRLAGLAWGAEDLSADLGAETNRDSQGGYAGPYRLARDLTLAAAAAAAVPAIDAVYTDFRDMAGLEAEARTARRDGFTAKMAIHPAQVPVINAVFTPDAAAIAEAEAVLAAFAAAPGAGVVALDGRMLDEPHRRRAERLLARARPAQRPGRSSSNTASTAE